MVVALTVAVADLERPLGSHAFLEMLRGAWMRYRWHLVAAPALLRGVRGGDAICISASGCRSLGAGVELRHVPAAAWYLRNVHGVALRHRSSPTSVLYGEAHRLVCSHSRPCMWRCAAQRQPSCGHEHGSPTCPPALLHILLLRHPVDDEFRWPVPATVYLLA